MDDQHDNHISGFNEIIIRNATGVPKITIDDLKQKAPGIPVRRRRYYKISTRGSQGYRSHQARRRRADPILAIEPS